MACAAVVVGLAVGCGEPAEPGPPAPQPPAADIARPIDPARITRARSAVPPGYEFAPLPADPAPAALWGLGPGWSADPPQCAGLVTAPGAGARGWSASGPGGIVYAVVTPASAAADPVLRDECAQWAVASARTTGTVTRIDTPAVPGADSYGMAATLTTVVEGGTETRAEAATVLAHADGYLVAVTVVADPGMPEPPLGPAFAAGLLTETVAVLRG